MDLMMTDEQRRWHDDVARFAEAELSADAAGRDERQEFWRQGYRRCGEFGLLGLPIPEEYGGRGADLPTTAAAIEGLGYGCPDTGLVFALGASLWTVAMPILEFGTPEQRRRWLPGLCDGTLLGANAASEPGAGSDIFGMESRAERRGDRWVLNGRKTWITGAPVADLFLSFARTGEGRGPLGVDAFLVPSDTPGLRVVREIPKLGLRTAPMGEVTLENCTLPLEAHLGRAGRGAQVFHTALEWERGAILAGTLGTMSRQLERCIDHARRRRQFGQPIGKFQAVSHRIVDMKLRLETSRLLIRRFAALKAEGHAAMEAAALAKLHVSECFVANSLDAIRIFGASGIVAGGGIECDLRDSVGGVIFSGTNDIQRNIIAQHLRL